jgi:hypothetical protein
MVGIYEQSTEELQVKYGKDEFMEYLEADEDDKKKELCDIIVFSINAWNLVGFDKDDIEFCPDFDPLIQEYYPSCLEEVFDAFASGYYAACICMVANLIGDDVEHYFDLTWEKISKRRGCMFDGKFVKWESMTDDQREECVRRENNAKKG